MKHRALVAVLATFGGSYAAAATTPLSATLADLINLGDTGVTVGDKTFYDFSYLGSPTSITPEQVRVIQAPGSDVGIEFQYHWTSTNANNEDAVIRFNVHVNDPKEAIQAVDVHFDGTAYAANDQSHPNADLGTNGTVTETINDVSGNPVTNNNQIELFDAGADFAAFNRDSATFMLPTPARDLMLEKDISAHSTIGGGTAAISIVDNTFPQTPPPISIPLPAPAWAGLSAIALGLWSPVRRRLFRLLA